MKVVDKLLSNAVDAANRVMREHRRASIICRFGVHTWSRWQCLRSGHIVEKGHQVGVYWLHARACERCGAFQARKTDV